MKKNSLLLAVMLILSLAVTAQTKRALIVAIGNYPDPKTNRWKRINSLNDVPLIKDALLKQKFLPANINVITDSQCTKTGIETALDDLVRSAQTGDVVVIHFSCHGVQIEDDNGDEIDGLDECIVPYGAVYSRDTAVFKKLAPGYLRDDLFGEKITLLRNKLGKSGNILVSIDACHSGTGTRGGTALVRGDNSQMVSGSFNMKQLLVRDTAGVFKDTTQTKLNADAATYVVISAAQAQELNAECYDDQHNAVGSLSYALSKTLNSLDGTITYRNLFARVQDIMWGKVPDQKPVIEGDGIDNGLFGGHYEKQATYFTINMDSSNSRSVVLNSGTVSGVTVGSIVSFFPGGTPDFTKATAIQKGTVVAATSFAAEVKLDQEDTALLKRIPWAVVSETAYGSNKIKLGTTAISNEMVLKIKDGLKDFQSVVLDPDCDLYFDKSTSGNGLSLRYPVSGNLFADTLNVNDPAGIKAALKRYDRFRYLRNLKFTEDDLSANVELVFLDADKKIDVNAMKEHTKLGRLELKKGDVVYVRVTNTGKKKFCINIVDITSDGIISPVFPNSKLRNDKNEPAPVRWENCMVDIGKVLFFDTYPMQIDGPPFGEETFKVFLSSEALDLEDILINSDANNGARGGFSNLAKIFRESAVNEAGQRGGGGKINTNQNGTIFNLNFYTIPK